jgi:nucleotide-binding universal stress UspA family protein
MNPPVIIVGVDGSPASQATLRWAAAEAVHRNRELLVVHAFDWRVAGARAPIGGAYAADARIRADALVESAVADAKAAAPDVRVRGEALLGAAGPTLVQAAKEAELVVAGSRGRGGFASLLLGSVSQQVATHARGPVVVVRGRPDITTGPIVVGVDGSDGAGLALQAAFDEAVARGTGIVAVRIYQPAHPPWGTDVPPYVEDRAERKAAEAAVLAEEIGTWRDKYPTVPVEQIVVDGHPADVLTGLSASAQLVVVGTRGHGGFTGLLLGSVGLQLLHHADSPVLIARSHT